MSSIYTSVSHCSPDFAGQLLKNACVKSIKKLGSYQHCRDCAPASTYKLSRQLPRHKIPHISRVGYVYLANSNDLSSDKNSRIAFAKSSCRRRIIEKKHFLFCRNCLSALNVNSVLHASFTHLLVYFVYREVTRLYRPT